MVTNTKSQESTDTDTSPKRCHLHVAELSPHRWPPEVGELVILYTSPDSKTRGFVGVVEVVEQESRNYIVRLLDSVDEPMILLADQLISTGQTPQDLLTQYIPTDLQLSHALETERTFPDFETMKTKTSKSTKSTSSKPKTLKQALKSLNKDQAEQLMRLMIKQVQETKIHKV